MRFAVTGIGDAPEECCYLECDPNGQWGFLDDHVAIADAFAHVLTTSGDHS